jgi:hypothetical protein
MAEIALCLTQVVRLGETLARQHLVGDLRLTAVRIWVEDARSRGRPLQEPAPGGLRCATELRAHAAIALRVDDDRAHTALDGTDRHQRLGDRLARPRGPHYECVTCARMLAERDRHLPAPLVATERQPLHVRAISTCSNAATLLEHRCDRAQAIHRSTPLPRDLRKIRAGLDVFAMPAPTANSGNDRCENEREREASEPDMRTQNEREHRRRPRPLQMTAPHVSRREQSDRHPEPELERCMGKPLESFTDGRPRILLVFGKRDVRGHEATPF